jgi:hypothetical protein
MSLARKTLEYTPLNPKHAAQPENKATRGSAER